MRTHREGELHYTLGFDYRAYDAIRRDLSQLTRRGRIAEAKAITLKLMEKGCFQIECSDEGLMQEGIESRLKLVISAVAESPAVRW
jgi:hypothetical protein